MSAIGGGTRNFLMTKQSDGRLISVVLRNYEIKNAVPSPRVDFCEKNKTITAWLSDNRADLNIDGISFLINPEHSLGWSGTPQIFYYNTFTFYSIEDCKKVAGQSTNSIGTPFFGPVIESTISSQTISFVKKEFNVGTSAVDYILKIDYQIKKVQLTSLRSGGDFFEPRDWTVFAEGGL